MRRVVVLASLVVIAISCALVLTFDYGRDQAIYAVVAREILAGGMPYRDVFDFKPPGIFVIYALARAVFGSAQWGIRVVEVASMLVTAWGLVRLSRVHFGDPTIGFVGAALAAEIHAQLDFWHTAQPETFGGMLTVVGLVAASSAFEAAPRSTKKSLALWAASGALFGFASLMKPTLAAGGAVTLGWALVHSFRARRGFASSLRVVLAIVGGGVLPIALVLAWFAARGALASLYQVLFVFTPGYTKIGWQHIGALVMLERGAYVCLVQYSGLLLAGLVALALFRPNTRQRPFVAVLAALVAFHIVGVALQGKFFAYHVAATFPLTSLLAALGVARAVEWTAQRIPVLGAASAVVFAVCAALRAPVPSFGERLLARSYERLRLFVLGPMDVARRDKLATVADVDAGENRAVAAYVASHTKPGDPIYVWGFECVIYDLADRPFSSSYIYDVPQRASWSRERMRAALMKDIDSRKPAAIVVEHGDVFSAVTGNNLDSARSLEGFPELFDLLYEDYEPTAAIGDFDVYLPVARDH